MSALAVLAHPDRLPGGAGRTPAPACAAPAARAGHPGPSHAHIKAWRILHTDYRRPLHTFEQTITAALSLHAFKTTL